MTDLVWFRCDDDQCDLPYRVRVEMRTPSRGLPTPGPCPMCRGPMRLGGRVRDVGGIGWRAREEFEVSG